VVRVLIFKHHGASHRLVFQRVEIDLDWLPVRACLVSRVAPRTQNFIFPYAGIVRRKLARCVLAHGSVIHVQAQLLGIYLFGRSVRDCVCQHRLEGALVLLRAQGGADSPSDVPPRSHSFAGAGSSLINLRCIVLIHRVALLRTKMGILFALESHQSLLLVF